MNKYTFDEVEVFSKKLSELYRKEEELRKKIIDCKDKGQRENLIAEFNALDFDEARSKFLEAINNCDSFY